MEFATGALGTLVQKLGKLLQDEYNLQKKVKKDIEFVNRELKSVHGALHDVGEVPPEQLQSNVKIWAQDVRELSYDMEDIVDTFLVSVQQGSEHPSKRSSKRFIKKLKSSVTKAKARHEISQEIKDIKERVKEVAERRDRWEVSKSTPAKATTIYPPISALYVEQADLVGIDGPRDELIRRLNLEGDDQKIVSVVGFGGLGKTTIAKTVHDKIKNKFDCTAFVPVSQNPDMIKVLKDILYELDKEKYEHIHEATRDVHHFIDEIRDFLQHKRYLIVVDDIWKTESWDTIKDALVKSCGSRIIITTRNLEVGKQLGEVYSLQPLSGDDKLLFYKRIGDRKGKYNEENEVVTKILSKCGGVPLAIITIASSLAGIAEKFWSEVYESIGFGNEGNQYVDNTRKILSFSYYDLPDYLKTCLLYLSVFPEDHYIPMHSLIWQWIAEGFVHEENNNKLFEVGEGYFNELINRSMIQPIEWELMHKGTVRGCRVHDMVLDLIRKISREENYVSVSDNMEEGLSNSKVRRSSVISRTQVEYNPQVNCSAISKLRSLHATYIQIKTMAPFSRLRVLRVLRLERCAFKEGCHLKCIRNLYHLRYLGLLKTPISELPREIGDLKFLQTLELLETGIEELPYCVGQLTQLLRLITYKHMKVPEDGVISRLTSLEELAIRPGTHIQSARRLLKDLGKLTQLRVLRTEISIGDQWDEDMKRELVLSVQNLHRIQVLEINGETLNQHAVTWGKTADHFKKLRNVYLRFGFLTLPAWINHSAAPNLTTLYLVVKDMEPEDLKILGSLPELCSLDLIVWQQPFPLEFVRDNIYFQKLRFLWTNRLALFIHDKTTKNIMPNLEYLQFNIDNRVLQDVGPCLDRIVCFHFLPSLRQVKVIIDCKNASATVVSNVEELLSMVAATHPNKSCRYPQSIHKNQDKLPNVPSDQRHQETEDNTARERLLRETTLGSKYPQLAAMLDENRYACSLQGAVARPEVVNLNISVYRLKVNNRGLDLGLGKLSTLQGIKAHIDCSSCFPVEVEDVEAEIKHLVNIHHQNNNPPTLEIIRYNEDKMLNSDSDSLMLEQQIWRGRRIWGRINHWKQLHSTLYQKAEVMNRVITTSDDTNHQLIQRFFEQFGTTAHCVNHELLLPEGEDIPLHDRDLKRVTEDIAAMERALQILTIEYPSRFAAMLEEVLRYAYSLQSEDVVTQQQVEEEVSAAASQPNQEEGEPLVQSITHALRIQHL